MTYKYEIKYDAYSAIDNKFLTKIELGDSKIFENIIPILGQKYNLILIDLPGHGKCANFKNKFTLVNVIDEIYNIFKNEQRCR